MVHDTAILSYGHYYAKAPPLKDFATYFPIFYEAGDIESFTPFEAWMFGPPSFRLAYNQKPLAGDASLGDYNWYVEEPTSYSYLSLSRGALFYPIYTALHPAQLPGDHRAAFVPPNRVA
ncbi:unnamed protein product [Linum trigynum]|uniref:Uncharacterized protein n=1 Tax=Linum trigynum TaxID=586398 RepID=A0AAV2ERQ6_9ROSI